MGTGYILMQWLRSPFGPKLCYAIKTTMIVEVFYHNDILQVVVYLLALLNWDAWVGIFRKFLVDSLYKWWPTDLVQESLFRAFIKMKRGNFQAALFFVGRCSKLCFWLLIPSNFSMKEFALYVRRAELHIVWDWEEATRHRSDYYT
ncbi:hypothetical protein VNO77_18146 [Canavalia gladiata]|uniref:Uncharacterized protein n=1 Tax=Canavalia gladiata TaxID=3824 RepID=A0AAN9QHC8_CANGL